MLQTHVGLLKIENTFCFHSTYLNINKKHGVSLNGITRSMYRKFNCVTANFDRTLHGFYAIQISLE